MVTVSCTQFKPLVKPDLSDSCSMKAAPFLSATAAASEDGGPQKKARASEEESFEEKLMSVATAMSELAPALKLVGERMANESASHDSITQGLLAITERMERISENMKVTAEANKEQPPQPRHPILVRERAMRDLSLRLRGMKTMAAELLDQAGQGPQLESPMDEVRYDGGQEDTCRDAVKELTTEFRSVMRAVNAGIVTEAVTVEHLAQFTKALSAKRRLFGEAMYMNGQEVISAVDYAVRMLRDNTSLAAWARTTLEATEDTRRETEVGGSPSHEELHKSACQMTVGLMGPLRWSDRKSWRTSDPGDPKWMHAEHMTMKEHVTEDLMLELDMSTADFEEKAVRTVIGMSLCCMPIVINIAVAKTMWDVGHDSTRAMIYDCFLFYFEGVKGPAFVAEVLDKRFVWRHLLMSRRMLSNVLKEDEITMTGHLDRLSSKVDKLADVMGEGR